MDNFSLAQAINEKIEVGKNLLNQKKEINSSIRILYKTIKKKARIFLCGNGGSAADAQHLAAEFLVRLRPNKNRKPYAAISLAMDTSTITACGNDLGYENLFSRNLEALGTKKDVLIIISTSGNSKNIINVLKYAKKNKIFSIGFLGSNGGKAKNLCDINIIVQSSNVARIQEAHIFLGHFILEKIEDLIIKKKQ